MDASDISPEELYKHSKTFDELCQRRWDAGAAEYGPTTFMQNDVLRMMIEELVDAANYSRMLVIKLLWLSEKAAQTQTDMGAEGFHGTGEGWNE